VLMLQSLLWDDEVRDADFPELRGNIRVAPQELEMASKLVSSYESDFTPDKFTDDYQVQLRQLIDAKLKQGDAIDTEATFGEVPEKEGAEVVDLMEALRRSVEKNRGGSGKRRTASPSKSAAASAGKSAGTSSRKSTAKPARSRAAGSGKSSGETAKTKKKAG
jgi:DNA end-binding protein Ku